MTYEQNEYLVHYGIKGQKKGLRRFQNEDGSYTAEGKERYGIGNAAAKVALYAIEKALTKKNDERQRNSASTQSINRSGWGNTKSGMAQILKNEASNRSLATSVEKLKKAKDFISKFA